MQLQPTEQRQSKANTAWGCFAHFVYHFIDLILIRTLFFLTVLLFSDHANMLGWADVRIMLLVISFLC